MSKLEQLTFVVLWLILYGYFFWGIIWGNLTQKSYEARMRPAWRWFLMPTRSLQDPEKWKTRQKIIAWASLPFVVTIVIVVVISILRNE